MMRFLLVTGGLGYLGSHVVVEFMRASHIPIIIDGFGDSQTKNFQTIHRLTGHKPVVYQGSLLSKRLLNSVFSKYNFDAVFHLAMNRPTGDLTNSLGIITNNVNGTRRLLETMQRFEVKNLVFASSSRIYKGDEEGLIIPPPVQRDAHARSVMFAEDIISKWGRVSDNNYNTLRLFNTMGLMYEGAFVGSSYESFGDSFYSLCDLMLNKAIEPHFVYNTELTRDYIHIRDVLRVLIHSLLSAERGKSGIYNVGRGLGYTPNDLSKIYQEVSGKDLVTTPIFDRDLGEKSLISNTPLPFDLQATYSVKDALEEALKWYPVCD